MSRVDEIEADLIEDKKRLYSCHSSRSTGDIDFLISEVRRLEQELEDHGKLIFRQGELLAGVVNAINGDPDELTLWSHHDAPKLAKSVVKERDEARALAVKLADVLGDVAKWVGGMCSCRADDDYHDRLVKALQDPRLARIRGKE